MAKRALIISNADDIAHHIPHRVYFELSYKEIKFTVLGTLQADTKVIYLFIMTVGG